MVKELVLLCIALTASAVVTYTVSGLSSGGFMAHQMHVAYSSTVTGAGIVAAGPYYCSLGSGVVIQTACTENPWMITISKSIAYATNMASAGLIDPLTNLNNDPVVIFSGSLDVRIVPGVVQQTQAFYENFINPSKIMTYYNTPANHAWVTLTEGNPCWYLGSPYVNGCGFDLSGAIFHQLYPTLIAKGTFLPSNLYSFEQADYANIFQAGMSNRGWIYIPTVCKTTPASCTVHVNFHGCDQYYDLIGNTYVTEIGMNEWAESNSVVVIYPQTTAITINPEGCWDFWGYTNSNFALKSGLQMAAVWNMAQNYTKIITTALTKLD